MPTTKYVYWFSTKWPKQRKNEKNEKQKPNLSKGEQKTMENLAKRKDIIITNANKGSPVVIMDIEKYIKNTNHQLSDKLYNSVIWLMTQLTSLKKKTYFLKNWLTDWNLSIQNPQSFTFHPKYIKKKTQENQW